MTVWTRLLPSIFVKESRNQWALLTYGRASWMGQLAQLDSTQLGGRVSRTLCPSRVELRVKLDSAQHYTNAPSPRMLFLEAWGVDLSHVVQSSQSQVESFRQMSDQGGDRGHRSTLRVPGYRGDTGPLNGHIGSLSLRGTHSRSEGIQTEIALSNAEYKRTATDQFSHQIPSLLSCSRCRILA